MIAEEQKQTFNRILDDCAEFQDSRLELDKREARITIGLHPEERGIDREPSWRRFALKGLSRVACWAGDEALPPELVSPGSPELLAFVATLFRNQWLYQWDVLGPKLPEGAPTWDWQSGENGQTEVFGLFWERPGSAQDWVMALWFEDMMLETPLETEQTLKEFNAAWGFLAEA